MILKKTEPNMIYTCLYVFKNRYAIFTTISPKNVIGPISTFVIDIKITTIINNCITNLLYRNTKIIEITLTKESTSKYFKNRKKYNVTARIKITYKYSRLVFTLFMLANILSCTTINSFGSINTCMKDV